MGQGPGTRDQAVPVPCPLSPGPWPLPPPNGLVFLSMPRQTPSSEITVPRPKFDPAAPVPEQVLHRFMATGVGQAPTRRLIAAMLGAAAGAVAVLLAPPGLWLVATPLLCVVAVSGWGLATKRLYILDLSPHRFAALRVLLHLLRAAMLLLGVGAAAAGAAGFVRLLLRPWSL